MRRLRVVNITLNSGGTCKELSATVNALRCDLVVQERSFVGLYWSVAKSVTTLLVPELRISLVLK